MHARRFSALLCGLLSVLVCLAPRARAGLDPAVTEQIASLSAEKASRSPAQRKIDSQLLYAIKMARGEWISSKVQTLETGVEIRNGRVLVNVVGVVTPALNKVLLANGAEVLANLPAQHVVRANIALDRLETIAAAPEVHAISPERQSASFSSAAVGGKKLTQAERNKLTDTIARAAARTSPNAAPQLNSGTVQSEGDVTHRADVAREAYNTNGTGLKIGVLADGANHLSAAQASGDLPSDVVVLPGQVGAGDEGTAMLEIVHDLAPGASLYFASIKGGPSAFADNIRALRTAGCDIIVDGGFYNVESAFQDGQASSVVSNTNGGVIAQAVSDVTSAGALYFTAAGDNGNVNDNTASVWEGDFTNGGTLAVIGGAGSGPVNDFNPGGGGSQYNTITLGASNAIVLQWADPLGGASDDYDLYVLNSAGTALIAASTGTQSGTQDPIEMVGGSANATNNRIVVAKFAGNDRYLRVNAFGGTLQFKTAGQIFGHGIVAAAFSVSDTSARAAYPDPFDSSDVTEVFHSDGPRRIFFQSDGTPYTPGNFSSTGGVVRQKPDFTAADDVLVSGAGGFASPYVGTNAAAAHAAAIAALLKGANPALTSNQIRSALNASAIDIDAPGVDRDSGAGIIMADQALQNAGLTPGLIVGQVTATETNGDGNGFVEPGEEGALIVELVNPSGGATASNITAVLTSNTPGVTVTPPGTSSYPDIAPGSSQTNNTPFQYSVSSSVSCPSSISFTLTVTFTGGPSPRVIDFTVPVGRNAVISTTLDTTAPADGTFYTATTGLQTGRLARNLTPSNCGISKPNPGINAADGTLPHRYDAYTFENSTNASICVKITLTTSAANALLLQSEAYAPTFIEAQPDRNYLGDIQNNSADTATRSYSVDVPANTSFVVVVNEVNQNGGIGTAYTLTVEGLPCGTTSSPTANQPPVNSVPGNQTVTRNGQLVFSSVNGNAISISDPDAGSSHVQVTLTASHGTITLSGTSGLSFTVGDGTGDATMTFTGSIANINAALNGATFTPTANFTGNASLQLTTNDQGNTGTGGAMSDTDSIAITVNSAGTIVFSASNYQVKENAGAATITVTRNSTTGAASVHYSTSNGSATAGADYTAVSGTLTFPDGVASRTFQVPITNDTVKENSESVLLKLDSPSGAAALGNPSSAVLTILDDEATPAPSPRAMNISSRGRIETGDRVMIAGAIISGNSSKRLLLRAIGPSLPADVGQLLADPELFLYGANGQLIYSNNDWRSTQQAAIAATGIPPADDRESAIIANLAPGRYTAIMRGHDGGSGIGLVEIYDLDGSVDSKFSNISTRAFVRTGNEVLIGGFILGGGDGNTDIVVRAIGPSLPFQGEKPALADPVLELRNANGALVRADDDWEDDPAQAAAIAAAGLAPSNPKESAIAETLPDGAYTAIVSGKDGTSGMGLVEVYSH